ncbi:hypothetical protein NQZ68_030111 [Dissostichus eleginoides]|nr:hypothetical protein NQZ68_030111 [Dissostichus eleginoides]
MLREFPCKLFHTTGNCVNGDECMFSHDALNEDTQDLLDKMLAEDAEAGAEDEKEVEELKKQGINPLPKPPPGVGLLPTPPRLLPVDNNTGGGDFGGPPSGDFGGPPPNQGPNANKGPPPGPGPGSNPCVPPPVHGPDVNLFQGGPPNPSGPPPHMGPPPPCGGGGGGPGKKIPSLFEIKVQPTGQLAHKLAVRGQTPSSNQGQTAAPGPQGPPGAPPPCFPLSPGMMPPDMQNMGPNHGMNQGPPNMGPPPMMGGFSSGDGPPHGGAMPPGPPPGGGNFFNNFFHPQDSMMEGVVQEGDNYQGFSGMDERGGAGNVGHQSGGQEGFANGASANQGGISVPDFLPPAQRVLFMRIQQKQQEEEERARRMAEGGAEKSREAEGDSGNWYSSEDEDGGSSVTSILKTLRQQTQAPPKSDGPRSDPRLLKASPANPPPRPADPRMARDPRLARGADSADSTLPMPTIASSGPPADPRLARLAAAVSTGPPHVPPATKPEPPLVYKPPPLTTPAAAEEEETERVLRDKPVPIPLDPLMGMALRDPRSQLQQFSHIKKDIVLHMPAFIKTITWSPEDLLPLPAPKQDLLPLPPGIPPVSSIEPRPTRSQPPLQPSLPHSHPPPLHPHPPPNSLDPPAPSSTLPDFELLSRILKTVNSSPSQTPSPPLLPPPIPPMSLLGPPPSMPPPPVEKPVDPRMSRKGPSDPRLQPQKSALKQPSEPLPPPLPSASLAPPSSNSTPPIAPYDPRMFSSGGAGRGVGAGPAGGASVLSNISLYDPRTNKPGSPGAGSGSNNSPNSASVESKPSDPPAAKPKSKEPLFVRKSALDQPEPEKSVEQGTDRYNSYNRPRPKPAPSPNSTAQGGPAAAAGQGPPGASGDQGPAGVHNLPVSTLFGAVKQAAKPGGTGSPFGGSSPVQAEQSTAEQDKASLKDVFKGFDPTASPFCQ